MCVPFKLYHPTNSLAGMLGIYYNRLTRFELSLRLLFITAGDIILQQHLGLTHATHFIRTVDP